MLICVADCETTSMDVRSTWNLLCGVLAGHSATRTPKRIVLRPDESKEKWRRVCDLEDGTQEILVGHPIAHITHDDIVDEERMEEIALVLGN